MPIAPGGVVRSAVLPGFQWRLDHLDQQPPLETLMNDPVYQNYVLLNLRQERQRADQAELRAQQEQVRVEQERQRADQAELRAQQEQGQVERLTAQLRALGIEPKGVD